MEKNSQKNEWKIPIFAGIFLVWGGIALFPQTLGDVNGSGSIDIVDALQIAQYYVGLSPSGFIVDAADTDCSGQVNIVDALRVAQYYVGLLEELSCGDETPAPSTPTPVPAVTDAPGTEAPTGEPGELHTGNSTYFYNLGSPYGGCGLHQSELDSQNFVAVNVQNSPGDYTTFHTRPISAEYADTLGFFDNGKNCGRWVRVTIGDFCNGTNDGAMNQPFCRGGSGWTEDAYNGAVLDMIVSDSCYDGNAWCRDDPNHLDLAFDALNKFVKDGKEVGDMYPDHYNNRQIHWQFIEAPNYTGDIRIGFMLSAQIWWPAIAISHLRNGIHGVDYWDGESWVKAEMNGDLGQSYIIGPTVTNDWEPGRDYRIRVYDVNDRLINDGRIYNFSFPESCGDNCSPTFTEVEYTVE
ncbi:MAG: dockerin type I repeat-containing protein [Spirochaetales bacterium]|nr:dockerin type I repeat-containing protein [Spirochaetales bacterium]